jgi:hypothetical protein
MLIMETQVSKLTTSHINLNILNIPEDSQNICDELKSTVVCRAIGSFSN